MLLSVTPAAAGHALQQWAGPAQALAIIVALPLVALYVWRAWRTASLAARLASVAADAVEALKASTLESQAVLREVQAARAAEAAPYVIAYLDITEEHLLYAVVKNIGTVPAQDVTIVLEPPPTAAGGLPESWELPAFLSAPIPFFPPQYELRSILGVSLELFAEDSSIPTVYQVKIAYQDAFRQARHVQSYTLDLGVFRNARSGRSTTLTDIHAILMQVGDRQRSLAEGIEAVRDQIAEAHLSVADLAHAGSQIDAGADGAAAPDPPPPVRAPEQATQERRAEATGSAENTAGEDGDIPKACRAWRTLGERRRWESAGSLQRHLRELSQAEAGRDGEEGTPCAEAIADPAALEEVLGHRFYLDGGQSLRAFDGAVDCLLASLKSSFSGG